MKGSALETDLATAIESARLAGKGLLSHFGKEVGVSYKTPDQPVTVADMEADRLLRDALLRGRPGYGWISEEMSLDEARKGERVWVVDPLDGTRNFIEGRRDFAICIGLLEAGQPVLGVIHHPFMDVTYWATAGGGAFRDGERIAAAVVPEDGRILVASFGEAGRGQITKLPHSELLLVGSTALKMMRVAEGAAHVYVSTTPKGIWDICAGSIIVAEAAGQTTDLSGAPVSFDEPQARVGGLIVTGREGTGEIRRIADQFAAQRHI